MPTRPPYGPGELVDYTVQDNDTLPALAARFNTSVAQIRQANPIIPDDATTLPPGMPMKIPIYYLPLWGSPYQILPDADFVDGPNDVGFDPVEFVKSKPGWLKDYKIYAYDGWRTGPEMLEYVAINYSVSPRLLLAMLEYRAGALSNPAPPDNMDKNLLGYTKPYNENLYLQLMWLADYLNDGYYRFIDGKLLSQDLSNSEMERFDPWQNAATITLHRYFNKILPVDQYRVAISSDGFAKTYKDLFGDPWEKKQILIPGSLQQPEMKLPFVKGKEWSYTGGPHTGWGDLQPWAAIDFAPPAEHSGCTVSPEWVAAMADGILTRSDTGQLMLDTDGDGDERTGWAILYLHIYHVDASQVGKHVKMGDVIGHPSCEGGHATGTHVHIARKYNGEWIQADGIIPFNLEGWVVHTSSTSYLGTLTRGSKTLTACTCGDTNTLISSEK
jgi:murein DD-endopeptidase MepM/ murein hydrolase activator NlpD